MYLLPSSMETNLGKATATFTAFQSAAPSSTPFRQIAHPKGIQVFSSSRCLLKTTTQRKKGSGYYEGKVVNPKRSGDSVGDLFGMVSSRDPFGMVK